MNFKQSSPNDLILHRGVSTNAIFRASLDKIDLKWPHALMAYSDSWA